MSILHAILPALPAGSYSFWKPGERKSQWQPHVWFIQDGDRFRYVLKYAGSSPEGAGLLRREAAFYRRVKEHALEHEMGSVLPALAADGEYDRVPYIVLAYCRETSAQKWMGHFFNFRLYARIISWQKAMLDWLFRFQDNTRIRAAFGVTDGHYLLHNDLNYFNVLGNGKCFKVIDWENWGVGRERYYDALHMAVLPTILAGDADACVASFARHWVRHSGYARRVMAPLRRFIGELQWTECLRRYLLYQEALVKQSTPKMAAIFHRCADVL